jgi:hypothetical protein
VEALEKENCEPEEANNHDESTGKTEPPAPLKGH